MDTILRPLETAMVLIVRIVLITAIVIAVLTNAVSREHQTTEQS